jgi:predicted nucleotidyltransferase
MAETISNFDGNIVEASRMVLLEVVSLLADYGRDVVVVGGTAPEFLMPNASDRYIGTSDVDLAMRPERLDIPSFMKMKRLLSEHGYQWLPDRFAFAREVVVGGQAITVKVDILTSNSKEGQLDPQTGKPFLVWGFKAPGCELALDAADTVVIDGRLPDGNRSSATIQVAGIVAFLVMKANALCTRERSKYKDAWDIDYCLGHYPGGIDEIARQFRRRIENPVVVDGLRKLRRKFASPADEGPRFVADFEEIADQEDHDLRCRRAYERVREMLDQVQRDVDLSADDLGE